MSNIYLTLRMYHSMFVLRSPVLVSQTSKTDRLLFCYLVAPIVFTFTYFFTFFGQSHWFYWEYHKMLTFRNTTICWDDTHKESRPLFHKLVKMHSDYSTRIVNVDISTLFLIFILTIILSILIFKICKIWLLQKPISWGFESDLLVVSLGSLIILIRAIDTV